MELLCNRKGMNNTFPGTIKYQIKSPGPDVGYLLSCYRSPTSKASSLALHYVNIYSKINVDLVKSYALLVFFNLMDFTENYTRHQLSGLSLSKDST